MEHLLSDFSFLFLSFFLGCGDVVMEYHYGEPKRGCGFRKISRKGRVFYYLCGSGFSLPCDRLPFRLKVCPVCGSGLKFHRGFQWLSWKDYAGEHNECKCHEKCFVCHPTDEKYGLMWVGERYYTPKSFVLEAERMGVSKLVSALPKDLQIGKTKVLLAHRRAWKNREPAIFFAFVVRRVEVLVRAEEADEEWVERLRRRGVTVIVVEGQKQTTLEEVKHNEMRSLWSGIAD